VSQRVWFTLFCLISVQNFCQQVFSTGLEQQQAGSR
jgi:hypothetical protein